MRMERNKFSLITVRFLLVTKFLNTYATWGRYVRTYICHRNNRIHFVEIPFVCTNRCLISLHIFRSYFYKWKPGHPESWIEVSSVLHFPFHFSLWYRTRSFMNGTYLSQGRNPAFNWSCCNFRQTMSYWIKN